MPQRHIWFPLHYYTINCAVTENHLAKLGQYFAEDVNPSQVSFQSLFHLCGYYGCGKVDIGCTEPRLLARPDSCQNCHVNLKAITHFVESYFVPITVRDTSTLAENFTGMPNCEDKEEKGRGKTQGFPSMSQEAERNFKLQRVECWVSELQPWSWTIINWESSLHTWPRDGWLRFYEVAINQADPSATPAKFTRTNLESLRVAFSIADVNSILGC